MSGRTGIALGDQLGRFPKAFGMTSVLLGTLALLPGLPFVPFALLAGATGWAARELGKRAEARTIARHAEEAAASAPPSITEEPIAETLAIDPVRVEIGYALLPLVNESGAEQRLDDQVRALRRQMALDYGFVLPPVRILDNMALGANDYVIHVREAELGRGEARIDRLLVINPDGRDLGLSGEETREPVFNLPALWIGRELREEAGFRGLTVVDPGTVITTHLTEIVKDNIADLLTYAETSKLLSELHKDMEKLVADIVPSRISISGIQRILQNLLSEGVSIRDLQTILEGIAEAAPLTHNLTQMTEHVRARLARQISTSHMREGAIPILTLSGRWDQEFTESIVGDGDERQLAMAPSSLQGFIANVREAFDRVAGEGEIPCLLTNPTIRPFVRSIIERVRPATVVLSQNEVHPRARIRTLGMIG